MNAFTFGDQAFLARAGTDYNTLWPVVVLGANLILWHEASDYSAFANDHQILPAETWLDRAQGLNAVPKAGSDATNRPVFKTNIFSTGQPAVHLDSTGAGFTSPGFSTNACTIIAVTKNLTGRSELLGTNGFTRYYPARDAGPVRITYWNGGGDYVEVATPANPLADAEARVLVRSAGSVSFYVNRTAFAGGAVGATAILVDEIGSGSGGPTSKPDIGCIIVSSGAITQANYFSIYDNYLKPRFGLP